MYEHDAAMLANYLHDGETDAGDTQMALRACRDKIQVERDRCARQASAGNENGGGPNAEAGAANGG